MNGALVDDKNFLRGGECAGPTSNMEQFLSKRECRRKIGECQMKFSKRAFCLMNFTKTQKTIYAKMPCQETRLSKPFDVLSKDTFKEICQLKDIL